MDAERRPARGGIVIANAARRRAVVGLALVSALSAAADPVPGRGEWFVSVNATHFETARDYDFGYASGGTVSLGFAATENLTAEVSYNEWSAERGDGRSRWFTAIWSSEKTKHGIRPYLLAGAGNSTHVPDSDWPPGRCGQWFAGVGVFGAMGERLYWRGEVRSVGTSGSGGSRAYFQLGLMVSVGGPKPAPPQAPPTLTEREPKCPGTPRGVPVDDDGCPRHMEAFPERQAERQGHTDRGGSQAVGLRLSERRVEAVHDRLAGAGTKPGRLNGNPRGGARPVAGNDTETGKQRNGRVVATAEGPKW